MALAIGRGSLLAIKGQLGWEEKLVVGVLPQTSSRVIVLRTDLQIGLQELVFPEVESYLASDDAMTWPIPTLHNVGLPILSCFEDSLLGRLPTTEEFDG